MKSFDGYLKLKLGNDYVLLAGGSHKALSDFSMSGHTHTWASITSKLTDGNAFNFIDNENYSTDIWMNYATSANTISTKPTLTFHFITGERNTSKYADVKAKGFVKYGKTDNEVLLAGGGSKALTDFSMSHSHPYLPTAGGTMTGDINMDGMDTSINWNVNYLYGWARRFIQFYQHSDSDSSKSLEEVFSIGSYGDTVGYVYSWIGTNNYAGANLRFYKDGSITIGDNPVLHAGNYTSYVYSKSTSDGRYVYKSGDTMTGTLSVATKTISYNNSYSTLVALYASLNKGLWDNNLSFWMLASNGTNVFTDKNLDIYHVDGININNLMYICVPYTNWGEISLKNNNGFCIGATGGALYVNYSPATKGTTVTKYYWMAGSNTTYSEHTAAKWITAGSSNQYVVLGDGTTKALSTLSDSHEHNYIVSAATVSTIASTDFTSTHFSYNIVTGDTVNNLKIDTQVGVISMPWYGGGGGNYGGQLLMGVNNDKIAFRTRYGGSWRTVHELIHSDNWSSYITESTLGISGKYLPLTGGTMSGDINFNNMNNGLRYLIDYLAGWARSFLSIYSNNGASHSLTELFHIGAYGGESGYIYTYIGRGDYSSGNNIRFNADNTIYLGDSPSTGTLTANTSLVRTNAVTITSNSSYFTEMYFHNQNVLNFTMRGNWQTLYIGYGSSAISGSYFPTSYVFCAGTSSTYANITAANYYTTSDARKKLNIHKISDNIKQFEWKETGETSYGFVAQDLEVKHPELVNDDGNMKTVNYNAALSLVVAKLENRVKELEAKLGIEASPCI